MCAIEWRILTAWYLPFPLPEFSLLFDRVYSKDSIPSIYSLHLVSCHMKIPPGILHFGSRFSLITFYTRIHFPIARNQVRFVVIFTHVGNSYWHAISRWIFSAWSCARNCATKCSDGIGLVIYSYWLWRDSNHMAKSCTLMVQRKNKQKEKSTFLVQMCCVFLL